MAVWLIAVIVTSAAFAMDARYRRDADSHRTSGWEAVGRLNLNRIGFCTGALIAPDTVLTAAHCLFDKASGRPIPPAEIEFLAGFRDGGALAYREVVQAVMHPDYAHVKDRENRDVRHDLALLRLDRPVRNGGIRPFGTAALPEQGARVAMVSYGQGRAEAPSLQDICHVIAQHDGVLVTSCDVEFGSSGAPIFEVHEGEVRIVAVVSAKGEMDGQAVSLGTALGAPLAQMRARLAALSGPDLTRTAEAALR